MTKRVLSSDYFADDKDVFDFLASQPRRMTKERLISFARRRGIVISAAEDLQTVLDYVSRLPIHWSELRGLFEQANSEDRPDRTTSRRVTNCNMGEVREAVEAARSALSEVKQTCAVRVTQGGSIVADVQYTELDTSRNRLAQKRKREFSMRFEETSSGDIVVSYDDQPRAHEIVNEVIRRIRDKNVTIDEEPISLAGITDAHQRTRFFVLLKDKMVGFEHPDVKGVKTDRMPDSEASHSEHDVDDVDEHMQSYVSQVQLRGDRILESQEYRSFAKSGFFVRHMVWTVEENSKDRYELEAGFGDAECAQDFTYKVKGVWQRKKDSPR